MSSELAFTDINDSKPTKPGDYIVKFIRNGEERTAKKRLFFSSNGSLVWMGGMRPFCENDQVIAWVNPEVSVRE